MVIKFGVTRPNFKNWLTSLLPEYDISVSPAMSVFEVRLGKSLIATFDYDEFAGMSVDDAYQFICERIQNAYDHNDNLTSFCRLED